MSMNIKGTYVGMASQISVQPFSYSYLRLSSSWYGGAVYSGIEANGCSVSADTLEFSPIILGSKTSISAIGCKVSDSEVGGHIRLGIYDCDANFLPKNLVIETASLSTASAGVVSETFASPVSLAAGIYWLAYVVDSANSLTLQEYTKPCVLTLGGSSPADGDYNGYSITHTFGALPNPSGVLSMDVFVVPLLLAVQVV